MTRFTGKRSNSSRDSPSNRRESKVITIVVSREQTLTGFVVAQWCLLFCCVVVVFAVDDSERIANAIGRADRRAVRRQLYSIERRLPNRRLRLAKTVRRGFVFRARILPLTICV
jgi:hypothetical protein